MAPRQRNLLLVVDDPRTRRLLIDPLLVASYATDEAADLAGLRRRMDAPPPAAVLVDIQFEAGSGLAVLMELRQHWPETPVIVVTHRGTVASAVKAMQLGAFTYLELPCGQQSELLAQLDEALESNSLDIIEGLGHGHETILVLDGALTAVGEAVLERLGYTVVAKRNAFEALATFVANDGGFDLVISDQAQPSVKLMKQILRCRPDMPIILCAEPSESLDADSAARLGVDQLLVKPFTPAQLARTVREVLG